MKFVVAFTVSVLVLTLAACLVYMMVQAFSTPESPSKSNETWVEVLDTQVNIDKTELTISLKVKVGMIGKYIAHITLPIDSVVYQMKKEAK